MPLRLNSKRKSQLSTEKIADAGIVQKLTTAQTQLAMCEKTIERLENKTRFASTEEEEEIGDEQNENTGNHGLPWKKFFQLIHDGQNLVAQVLQAHLDVRLETIKACVRPFSESDQAADNLARKTDAYTYAQRAIQRYCLLASSIRLAGDPAVQFAQAVSTIQRVLNEAVQDSPNLGQFLPLSESATPANGAGAKA